MLDFPSTTAPRQHICAAGQTAARSQRRRSLRERRLRRDWAWRTHRDYRGARVAPTGEGLAGGRRPAPRFCGPGLSRPYPCQRISRCAPRCSLWERRLRRDWVWGTRRELPSPRHRWLYFPQMSPRQFLPLRTADAIDGGRAGFMCHSAFEDPDTPPAALAGAVLRCG